MKLLAVLILAATHVFAQAEEFQLMVARGMALDHYGDYPAAVKTFRDAIAFADKHQLGDWARATTFNSLAMVHDEMGEIAEAVRLYRRSLAIIETTRGKTGPDYGTVLGNLAADYNLLGQTAAAESMLRESLQIFQSQTPPEELRVAITQSLLAPIVLSRGGRTEGEELLMAALATLRRNPGNDRQIPAVLNNLGVIRREQKRYDEAVVLFEETLKVVEGEYGSNHFKMMQTLNNLALTHYEAGRHAAAGPIMERALAIAEKSSSTGNPSYGALMLNYAEYLRRIGRKSEAKKYESRGKEVIADAARRNGVGMTIDIASFRRR